MNAASGWLGLLWFLAAVAVAMHLRPRPAIERLSPRTRRVPSDRIAGRSSIEKAWRDTVDRVPFLARRRLRRAAAQSVRELADVIDLFALAVASGLNLRLALYAVASRAPPAWTAALLGTVHRVERGIGVADALDDLPAATGEHAHPLVSVLVTSERYGTALLPALDRLAGEARLEQRRRAEEAARRVPVKLLFPLVLCILPAFGALTVAPLLAGALGSLRLG
jgi:tight adherence protein C